MAAADDESAAAREAAIATFAQKFPIDERAKDRLRCLPEDTLRRVFDDFRPAADSNPDFSRRLVGFLKGFNTSGAGPPARNPFASLAPSPAGYGSLALAQNAAASSMPNEQLELFKQSYPMDARAYDFLKIVPAEVQARVITTFKPPAVQADYSRIITAHIRFCLNQHREQQQLVNSHSVASLLGAQQQVSAASLLAGAGGASSSLLGGLGLGGLGGLGGTQALASVLAQTPGLAHLLAGGVALGYQQTAEAAEAAAAVAAIAAATAAPVPAEMGLTPEQLELFRTSYPMDARAFDFLKIVPPEVQQRVVSTFKAPVVQSDYSKIITSHIRFCLNQHREQQSNVQAATAPFFGGLGSAALLGQLGGVDYSGAFAAAVPQDPISMFRAQYPMDERAFDYLKNAPPEVQQRVITTFNPPVVQTDYSRLVTSHVKVCLMQQREHGSSTPSSGSQTAPQAAGNASAPAGGAPGAMGFAQLAAATGTARQNVSSEELELFRKMYPMDDRAFDYLAGAPPEVQERVIDTFNVSEVQADYSRAITAHVKFCLKQHKEQVPSLIALPSGTDAAQAVTMLSDFRQKYPTDDRAWNYLLQSSAEVKQRVLTEFSPPTGVDGDYSKAVTAYIRRCRDDEKNRLGMTGAAGAVAGLDLSALLGSGAAAGTDLSALLGQGAAAGTDLSALLGQGAAAGTDLSALLGQGAAAGTDLSALLGQGAAAGTDFSALLGQGAAAGTDLSALLGQGAATGTGLSALLGQGAAAGTDLSALLGQATGATAATGTGLSALLGQQAATAATGTGLSALLGQGASMGLDLSALLGQAAAPTPSLSAALLGQGALGGLDLSALLGQGAAADQSALVSQATASETEKLRASLGQLGSLATLIRQGATAPAIAAAGEEDAPAAKRLRTDAGPSSSLLEQAALALAGAHFTAG